MPLNSPERSPEPKTSSDGTEHNDIAAALPKRIGSVYLGREKAHGPGAIVLDDFFAATAAYAKLSRSHVPERADSAADTLILCVETPLPPSRTVLHRLRETHARAGARVYAIVLGDAGCSANAMRGCAERIKDACLSLELAWGGALIIGDAWGLERALRTAPRMGFWRRKISEGTDRLVAAARSGLPVSECQLRAGASSPIDPDDLIDVSKPIPAWTMCIRCFIDNVTR